MAGCLPDPEILAPGRDAYNLAPVTPGVQRNRIVFGLAVAFGGMAGLLAVVSLFEPFVFVVAIPTAIAAYFFWYHASGRLRDRVRRTAGRSTSRDGGRSRGGFGAGPRRGRGTSAGGGDRRRGGRRRRADPDAGLDAAEARRVLGVDPDASEREIKRAYREKVKDVHPDSGGDEETFKQVTEAYETLVD